MALKTVLSKLVDSICRPAEAVAVDPPKFDFDSKILADQHADKLHVGDIAYNRGIIQILTSGSDSDGWQGSPINTFLTVYRGAALFAENIKASVLELIPHFAERLPPSSAVLPSITALVPVSSGIAIGDVVYPYTLDDEAYIVSTIKKLNGNLLEITGVLK